MISAKKVFVSFSVEPQLWDTQAAIDWQIHKACERLAIALCNAGLRQFGNIKLRWLDPNVTPYHDFFATGCVYVHGVPVEPVQPTEWDTCG